MNDDTRKQIALSRYKLISPVLAETGRNRNEWFREVASREHTFPRYGTRKVAVSTLKMWLKAYKEKGFDGLMPKRRVDVGRPRKLGEKEMAAIRGKCKVNPHWTVQLLHEDLVANHQLGEKPICYNTLLRIVRGEGLLSVKGRSDARKRFEMAAVNEMWTCDFMHGPKVELPGGRSAKSILCAIIDDHSRVIVGHSFSTKETVSSLTLVLKAAFEKHGIPRRLYVDNGSAFSSDLLTLACARTGISLTHSRPYDSPSRGKIERFFRTVRDRFIVNLGSSVTLDEINMVFDLWLQEDYLEKHHNGIDSAPLERYRESIVHTDIRRVTPAELNEAFLAAHERIVNNDATLSFKGKIYEVPSAYIRQKVEIRHPVDEPEELFLYDNGARISRLKLVDTNENARVFRPQSGKLSCQILQITGEILMQELLSYFGCKYMPFDKNIRATKAIDTEPSRECAARLAYIKYRGGIMLLTGDPGVGKTISIRQFCEGLNENIFRALYTPLTTLKGADLLRHLNDRMGLPRRASKAAVYEQLQNEILESREQRGKTVVLIIDEAHLLGTASLQELRLLTNFKMDSFDPFILILAGQIDLRKTMELGVMEAFSQRIALRHTMSPLAPDEAVAYVEEHMKIAGAKEPIFSPDALAAIHEVTYGIPRRIGMTSEMALTLAMLENRKTIDADLILKAKSLA